MCKESFANARQTSETECGRVQPYLMLLSSPRGEVHSSMLSWLTRPVRGQTQQTRARSGRFLQLNRDTSQIELPQIALKAFVNVSDAARGFAAWLRPLPGCGRVRVLLSTDACC